MHWPLSKEAPDVGAPVQTLGGWMPRKRARCWSGKEWALGLRLTGPWVLKAL